MGQSTQHIFFTENENSTPGPPLERFWIYFGHWKHFYSDPTLDPNLGTFRFTYNLLYKLTYQNPTGCTKTAVTRNRSEEKLTYSRSRFILACF